MLTFVKSVTVYITTDHLAAIVYPQVNCAN